jgi:hypothetical protein
VYCESHIAPLLDELKYNVNLRMHYIGDKQVGGAASQGQTEHAPFAVAVAVAVALRTASASQDGPCFDALCCAVM